MHKLPREKGSLCLVTESANVFAVCLFVLFSKKQEKFAVILFWQVLGSSESHDLWAPLLSTVLMHELWFCFIFLYDSSEI